MQSNFMNHLTIEEAYTMVKEYEQRPKSRLVLPFYHSDSFGIFPPLTGERKEIAKRAAEKMKELALAIIEPK